MLLVFWQSAAGFWGKCGARVAWYLSATLVLLILLNLAASFGMNLWNRLFFDALQNKDSATALFMASLYVPLLLASVIMSVMQVYARMTLQRRWREWLNNLLMDCWLNKGRYYHLNLLSDAPKNPEHRISDDVRVATESPVEFASGIATAILSAVTFVIVLWTIGGSLTIRVDHTIITIPAFLVLAAVAYAVVASGLMLAIGRNFVSVAEQKNQAEAEYRYVLTRLRENGEGIALLGGEQEERTGIDRSFTTVLRSWRNLCFQHMRTTMVSQTSGYIAPIMPVILCAPKFLDGSMTLGEVMQAASAFTIVQTAFNWLVDNYPRLADWAASAKRVVALQTALHELDSSEVNCLRKINRLECRDKALHLRNVSIRREDGTLLIKGVKCAIKAGERVLITGESGSGKSTLSRAVAGVWPWGEGEIEVGAGKKLMVLPQRPYVPTGTLRRAATYPDPPESRSWHEISRILDRVGLSQFVDQLEEHGPWDQTLSGGEKQRLGLARILLHRPDIVVLDEATAALDPASQSVLMQSLFQELSDATIVSIAHRSELERFHDRKIVLRRINGTALAGDFDTELKVWRRATDGARMATRNNIPQRVLC